MPAEQFLPRNEHEKDFHKPIPNRNNLSTVNQTRARILVVEDDRLIAEDLKEVLENAGHQVVGIFASGEDVLQNINDINPDAILMDIRLKGSLDGIQTAITIHNTIKPIPIVFLTAHSRNQYPHLNSLPSSSFVYMTKPFQIETLLRGIKRLLSSGSK
jgi:DNA-binding response OmpR family regulator